MRYPSNQGKVFYYKNRVLSTNYSDCDTKHVILIVHMGKPSLPGNAIHYFRESAFCLVCIQGSCFKKETIFFRLVLVSCEMGYYFHNQGLCFLNLRFLCAGHYCMRINVTHLVFLGVEIFNIKGTINDKFNRLVNVR